MSEESSGAVAPDSAESFNTKVINDFRAHQGRVGGNFEGAPILLLHTVGARSGAERVNPMMYLEEGGRIYVFASKSGADTNPDWYLNLVAHAAVTVERGTETYQATAQPIEGEEHERIYAIQAARYRGFAEYQAKTSRVIPVVELVRD